MQTSLTSDLTVKFDVGIPDIRPAWMIGARTHLLDCWDPQIEWIRVPGILFSSQEFHASVIRDSVSQDCTSKSQLRNRRGTSEEPLKVNGLYHDVRQHGGENFAHAILDGAVSSLACQSAARALGIDESVTAIIPANSAPYVREVYKLIGVPTLTTSRTVRGQRMRTNFNTLANIGLAKQLLPAFLTEKLEADGARLPKCVYLARRGGRCVRNADKIDSLLFQKGFTKIYPEQLPVIDQIRLLWHADAVIGVHGAALAALLFRALKTDSRPFCLIELFGPGYIVTLYRHLVAEIGGDWVGVRGRVTRQVVDDLDTKHQQGFRRIVSSMLSGSMKHRIPGKEPAWQRTHQSSSFDLDPASVEAAFDVIKSGIMEPPSRVIRRQTVVENP
ncbi:MAG TPA: glycosyltransferase family 61 protein [Planctomycetaceae bacterium]|nr:glycosyltransferase family 61 protein [Planctomycetaceae bacterium]